MADENTKTIDQVQAEPAEVNAEISSGENTKSPSPAGSGPSATTPSAPPVSLSGEANVEVLGEVIPVEAEISQSKVLPYSDTDSPVVSEAEPISNTVEPSTQDEVVKVEEKPEELIQEKIQTPPVPLSGEAKTSAPAVAKASDPEPKLTPVVAPAPEPVQKETQTSPSPADSGPSVSQPTANVAQVTHSSSLEALGARFMANMKRARELLVKARAALSLRRKKKIEKMMTLFLMKTKINNKGVRDLLHVSDDTATSYLNAMLKEGKIKKEGKGNQIYYTKI